MTVTINANVEAEVARIQSLSIAELRIRWRARNKSEPPAAFGPDLLRRSLAYKVQADAYGGLPSPCRRLLNQLVAQAGATNGKIVLPRRIKTGAVLIREWKGQSHRVMVLEQGFAYEGKMHSSLSDIARRITGTRWNGPRFFGLRTSSPASDTAESE
jgi:hypothetical protein